MAEVIRGGGNLNVVPTTPAVRRGEGSVENETRFRTQLQRRLNGVFGELGILARQSQAILAQAENTLSLARSLEEDLKALAPRVETAEETLEEFEPRIADAEESISSLEPRIAEAETSLEGLSGRVTDAETDLDGLPALSDRVTAAENAISNLQTDVSNLQTDVSNLQTDVQDHENRITALETP